MTNQEAIKILQGIDRLIGDDFYSDTIDEAVEMAIEALKSESIFTADRPKGEWVSRSGCYGVAYCSECNYELRVNNTNFCPACGADMRGEDE